jgi:hypothetical protein
MDAEENFVGVEWITTKKRSDAKVIGYFFDLFSCLSSVHLGPSGVPLGRRTKNGTRRNTKLLLTFLNGMVLGVQEDYLGRSVRRYNN